MSGFSHNADTRHRVQPEPSHVATLRVIYESFNLLYAFLEFAFSAWWTYFWWSASMHTDLWVNDDYCMAEGGRSTCEDKSKCRFCVLLGSEMNECIWKWVLLQVFTFFIYFEPILSINSVVNSVCKYVCIGPILNVHDTDGFVDHTPTHTYTHFNHHSYDCQLF